MKCNMTLHESNDIKGKKEDIFLVFYNTLPWDMGLYSVFISFIPDETLLPLGLLSVFMPIFVTT